MSGKGKIFLTGATGFIGSYLAGHLAKKGWSLTILQRPQMKIGKKTGADLAAILRSGRPPLPDDTRIVPGDITRPESYAHALTGHDALIHLAADYRVGLPPLASTRERMYRANVSAALELFDRATKAGIPRLVHTSTTAALGETHGALPGEDSLHNGHFRCYYEETKHIAHRLLQKRVATKKIPLTLAILGGVVGKGDTSALSLAFVEFLRGKLPFQVVTESRFQLCPVERVCDAFSALLEREETQGEFLFTGQSCSMPELFGRLAARSDKEPPKPLSASRLKIPAKILDALSRFGFQAPLSTEALNVMDGSTYTYSSAKAESELGWSAGDVEAYLNDYMDYLIHMNIGGKRA